MWGHQRPRDSWPWGMAARAQDWASDNLALDSYFPTINQLWESHC